MLSSSTFWFVLHLSTGRVYVGRCEVITTGHGQEPELECRSLPKQAAPGGHAAAG